MDKKRISREENEEDTPPTQEKKKRRKKKKNKKSRFACKKIELKFKAKRDMMVTCEGGKVYNENVFLDVYCAGESYRAHFIKKFFTVDEMLALQSLILSCPRSYWERRSDDKRGDRRHLYTGHWKHRFFDLTYPAGKAGKIEIKMETPILKKMLEMLGLKATQLLILKRPDVYIPLLDHGFALQDFGAFHLFMCPAGCSYMHVDKNDFVAFVFLIYIEEKAGGEGLHIGGCGVNFNLRIGDAVLLDSDVLWHGSETYEGEENIADITKHDRLVGLFIIHRKYMGMKGMPEEDMERETHGWRTKPQRN
jgi:hypothetical protein